MPNPFVFIVGCPRSGTTMLQRLVDAHPGIAIMPESHWILQLFLNPNGLVRKGLVTPELISHLVSRPEFSDLHIDRKELDALVGVDQPISYANFIAELFDLYGKTKAKALVGNKTPGFVRRLPTLHMLWPKARFVHLIRDGRDVFLSTFHRPLKNPKAGVFDTWAQDPATTAALWWELNVRTGRKYANSLGPELYYEIRYESLVTNPKEECAALCNFLGLQFDDAMLRFYKHQAEPRAALPVTPGLRDWRSQMAGEDVERFEAATGELLNELSYPRAFPHPPPERAEIASRMRDTLARDPRLRYEAERKER